MWSMVFIVLLSNKQNAYYDALLKVNFVQLSMLLNVCGNSSNNSEKNLIHISWYKNHT